MRVLDADEDVANCVQAHPTQAVLATSGIEPVVKIWSPGVQVDKTDVARLIKLNQVGNPHSPPGTQAIDSLVSGGLLWPEEDQIIPCFTGFTAWGGTNFKGRQCLFEPLVCTNMLSALAAGLSVAWPSNLCCGFPAGPDEGRAPMVPPWSIPDRNARACAADAHREPRPHP